MSKIGTAGNITVKRGKDQTAQHVHKNNTNKVWVTKGKVSARDIRGAVRGKAEIYVYSEEPAGSVIIFSDLNKKAESVMTAMEKMKITREGLNKLNLEILKEKTQLDYNELAHALSVTRSTLISKKGEEKFSVELSERMVGLADIYSYGYEVFENQEKFNEWMFRPNKALNNEAPYNLIDSQFGREEVRAIIGRIDHGVYS